MAAIFQDGHRPEVVISLDLEFDPESNEPSPVTLGQIWTLAAIFQDGRRPEVVIWLDLGFNPQLNELR